MKILLLTESLGSGGAERQLVGLAVFLKMYGYSVKVISYLENKFYESFIHQGGVEYEFCPLLLPKLTRVFRLREKLKEYSPEVVISFLSSVNVSLCLTSFFYHAQFIISERSHTNFKMIKSKLRYLLYIKSDYLVTNSYSEAKNIIKHIPYLAKKTLVIPNFVDTSYFLPADKKKSSMCGKIILGVGRLLPVKNVIRLCESIKILKEEGYQLKMIWVGRHCDVAYKMALLEKIRCYGLENVVELHDQTTDIRIFYQITDIFCLPSLFEGYPNVLCEAMSCGLPIACSNVCDNPLIVKDGENGFLFDPIDVTSMTNALRKLLDMDICQLNRMGEVNRDCVVQRNSKEKFVNSYLKLFDSVC